MAVARGALGALMLASFAIGTGEFVIVGLLPELAASFRVSVPAAGLLLSCYALAVAFGSPLVAAALAAAPPRAALLGLTAAFVAGDIACALAPDYAVMLGARVATALAHGAFFGLAAVVAAALAPPGRGARAVALLFTGMTVANVIGVPVGTWIGQAAGWRLTFAAVAGLAVVALGAIALLLPDTFERAPGGLRHEFGALRDGAIWRAMAVSTVSSAALFTVLTFLTPLLEREAGFTPHGAAIGLLVFGAGLTAGGLVGGRVADRSAAHSIPPLLLIDALALVLLGLAGRSGPLVLASLFAWGAAAFALVPPLQHAVVTAGKGAPRLASTLNQSAFNAGDALGAAIGAAVLAHAGRLDALPFAGAGIGCLALGPALLGVSAGSSRARRIAGGSR